MGGTVRDLLLEGQLADLDLSVAVVLGSLMPLPMSWMPRS